MRQIVARLAGVERELEHLHAGEARILTQGDDLRRHEAEILGNDIQLRKRGFDRVDKALAGALAPAAGAGVLRAVRHRPVALQTAEVVDAHGVIELAGGAQAPDPPAVAVRAHAVPVVERVAPELAVGSEVVGRHAGDLRRAALIVELEVLALRPHVRAVKRNIDRHVADDPDALPADVRAQRIPLAEEQILRENAEADIVREKLLIPAQHVLAAAETELLVLPLDPRPHTEVTLRGGIERIAAQPAFVFTVERLYVPALALPAALAGAAQEAGSSGIERAVIRSRRVAAEGYGIDFLAREKAVIDKLLKVDEIRVPGKGRVGLVRRVAVAGWAERQDLPVFLSGFPEKVGKLSRFPAQRSDAVRRRERRDMQNNSACSHGKSLFRL